jgi:D-lactate dehydrogenase (cytochrome)
MAEAAHSDTLASAFAACVGDVHVVADPRERAVMSNDIFFWEDGRVADLVVRPGSAAEVQACLRTAAALGVRLYSRGGGMSYTKGYVPTVPGAVMLDLRRLDKVREIDATDRYVVVEAGCTWAALAEALKPHGMKVAFAAPFSGIYSTVGGALSQAVPSAMKGILGLEVVRADGSLLRTASWGRRPGHGGAAPFFRDYGPDLTGLFLGDTGAFAVKTAAALHLVRKLPAEAHGSFAFDTYEDMAATMVDLGPHDFVTRRVGLDPFKSQNSVKVGFKEALKTLGDVTASGPTLLSGLKDSVKMAANANFMEGVKWSLHLSTEGLTEDAAEGAIAVVRGACLKRGREIANFLPRAMAARGFSVRGFLGKDGQRWVPTNSLWPLSRAVEVATAVQGFFAARRTEMQRHGMWESYMTNYGAGYFQCEPSFYWADEVSELHLRHLGADEAEKFRGLPANLPARAYARKLRTELRDFFFDLGAVHVQLAKFYRFSESLTDENWRLLREVKSLLDPDSRLNPGNLGL